jgi:hypothetical protein
MFGGDCVEALAKRHATYFILETSQVGAQLFVTIKGPE